MSRPKNADNNYELKDAVTGESLHTNPKQFRELQARYSLTAEELLKSYVGQKGRNKLALDKETVESAIAKYGLHPNIANSLRALRPVVRKTATVAPDASINVEVSADALASTPETPVAEETVTETEAVQNEEELLVA